MLLNCCVTYLFQILLIKPSSFFGSSAVMCKVTQYVYCSQFQGNFIDPPPDKTIECKYYPKLVAEAQAHGPGSIEAQRLSNHRNCKLIIIESSGS